MNALRLLETGEFSDVNVYFENEVFHLHKFPLLLKIGYVKDKFSSSSDLQIPFIDGGSKVLSDVIAFCYGKEIEINSRNVAFLNNAARMLDMFGKQNLVDLSDEYINIIITDMRVTHKFGPSIVALAYAAGLKNYEYSDAFIQLFDSVLSMWVRQSQHNDEYLPFDPVLTEFLAFLPDNVIIRIIQEISSVKSTHYAMAELTSKFFALRFALSSAITEEKGVYEQQCEDVNENQENKTDVVNCLKKAISCTCLPFERLSEFDKDLLAEELIGIDFESTPLDEMLDNVLSILPSDVPLVSKINVDWCKQALTATDGQRETSTSRSLILEITGKMLARFSIQQLRVIPPQTIKDILATINQRVHQGSLSCVEGVPVTSLGYEKSAGEVDPSKEDRTICSSEYETGSIAENLDLYFNVAIENQNMNIEEYIGLLKTAMPLDRRDNHDGLIRGICKLVKSKKDTLTDGLREEILSVLDLRRCSAAALQEALDANILPARAVAEAALRFAKQKANPNTSSASIPRERRGSPSPSRYSTSTTSLYRASRYALPFQHYAVPSAHHHFAPLSASSAASLSTSYLLSSPLRQRRHAWDCAVLYDRYGEKLPALYRRYDVGSSGDYTSTRLDNGETQWNENTTNKTAPEVNLRSRDY